jgi:hypothetical protein
MPTFTQQILGAVAQERLAKLTAEERRLVRDYHEAVEERLLAQLRKDLYGKEGSATSE